MTGPEARDEIAQIVKTVSTKWGGPAMRELENDPPIRKHFAIADALLAVGYRKHPEPEVEYVRGGVCLLCGEAVMGDGSHLDPDRHAEEVESITSGREHPEPEWEYGVTTKWGVHEHPHLAGAERYAQAVREEIEQGRASGDLAHHGRIMRRTKAIAGPWVPVGEGERRGDVSR